MDQRHTKSKPSRPADPAVDDRERGAFAGDVAQRGRGKRPRGKPQNPRAPPMKELERLVYSVREFAAAAGLSYGMLYKLWRQGKGPPSRRFGRRRVIEMEAGKRWLAGRGAR